MSEYNDDALLETEIGRIEAIIRSPHLRRPHDMASGSARAIRPRDAATIVIVDGKPGKFRVLMGRRNRNLTFMPGALVFPGGRVDPSDGSIPSVDELPSGTEQKIVTNLRGRPSKRRARGLAMAAIRELCEESGLLIGMSGTIDTRNDDWQPFLDRGIVPALGHLAVLSRAITPPGPPRRFDTWFFVTRSDVIGHAPAGGFTPNSELEQLEWIEPEAAIAGATREITRVMIVELMNRLKRDPGLDPSYPSPFYRMVRNRFHKEMM